MSEIAANKTTEKVESIQDIMRREERRRQEEKDHAMAMRMQFGGSTCQSAPSRTEDSRRRDPSDGGLYTRAEFFEFYGGLDEWNRAAVVNQEEYDRAFALRLQSGRDDATFVDGDRDAPETVKDEVEDEMDQIADAVARRAARGGPTTVTKHDPIIDGVVNSSKLTKFHGAHGVGDLTSEKLRLSNTVYNDLRTHFLKKDGACKKKTRRNRKA